MRLEILNRCLNVIKNDYPNKTKHYHYTVYPDQILCHTHLQKPSHPSIIVNVPPFLYFGFVYCCCTRMESRPLKDSCTGMIFAKKLQFCWSSSYVQQTTWESPCKYFPALKFLKFLSVWNPLPNFLDPFSSMSLLLQFLLRDD